MLAARWDGMVVMIGAFDEVRSRREHLLYRTLKTTTSSFPSSIIYVVDNGSTGEDAALVERMVGSFDGVLYRNVGVGKDGNRTAGRLANEKLRILSEEQQTPAGSMPSAVVLCDDDVWWYPGAERRLIDVWEHVLANIWSQEEEKLAIVGGYLEPVWPWNVPVSVREFPRPVGGSERVLIRPNAPGVALSFLLDGLSPGPGVWFRNWIRGNGPAPFEESMGYDVVACRNLWEEDGLLVGQMDLCDHTGWGASGWKNQAIETGVPLDRDEWGMGLV